MPQHARRLRWQGAVGAAVGTKPTAAALEVASLSEGGATGGIGSGEGVSTGRVERAGAAHLSVE